MKNVLIALTMILLGGFLFFSCSNDGVNTAKEGPDTVRTGRLNGDLVDFKKDTLVGLLDATLAHQMSLDYANDLWKSKVNEIPGGSVPPNTARVAGNHYADDATAIWFDLETLKNYIARVENSVAGAPNPPKLGVRIYYAKYPKRLDSPSLRDLSDSVISKHTVFLVPTYVSADYLYPVDFNIEDVGPDKSKPIPFFLSMEKPASVASIYAPGVTALKLNDHNIYAKDDTSIQNHGGLSPPPDPGVFPIPSGVSAKMKKTN